MEKYGNPEVGEVPESASTCLYELNFGVESLCYCVRDSMLKEDADILIVPLNGLGRFNHSLQAAMVAQKYQR